MAKYTIKYTEIAPKVEYDVTPICPEYHKSACAQDSYVKGINTDDSTVTNNELAYRPYNEYDNKHLTDFESIAKYVQESVSFPGLMAAMKQAMVATTHSVEYDADAKEVTNTRRVIPFTPVPVAGE